MTGLTRLLKRARYRCGAVAWLLQSLRRVQDENRRLRERISELLTVVAREAAERQIAHATALAEQRQEAANEKLRADLAEARAARELSKSNAAWHRIGGVWAVVDDPSVPPDIAERLRRVLQDPNYRPGVQADA